MSNQAVGRQMEILLIEDSLTEARLTVEALRSLPFSHRLTVLRDGEEAVEFLNRIGKYHHAPRPDLILLDLGLPKKDGREVLTEIKGSAELKSIPVVIMTISHAEEDAARSKQLQVDAYLTKPVDYESFLQLVSDLSRFWRKDMVLPARE